MTYSPIVAHHFTNPRNVGKPASYTAEGVAGDPGGGPFMIVYLDVDGDRIRDAAFETYGCGVAMGCGSLVTELVKGRTLDVARKIDATALRTLLGGLPLGKEHCADLAAAALATALTSISGGG